MWLAVFAFVFGALCGAVVLKSVQVWRYVARLERARGRSKFTHEEIEHIVQSEKRGNDGK
jgi:hypothetical protein